MLRLFLLLVGLAQAALALEVKEVRWGFDGKLVRGKFNLVSVLVTESGPKAFEGELVLTETRGSLPIGAPYVQPIFVSPHTSRWVQFLPFSRDGQSWQLSWGKGADQGAQYDGPDAGAPATVLLIDASSSFANIARMKAFPEELFPTSVAATDGLGQVVLDHVPRWDGLRREAFLDWARRGGVVHLVRGPAGVPVFKDDLAVLNPGTDARHRVGAGTIVRHDVDRGDCDEKFLIAAGFPPQTRIKSEGRYYHLHNFDEALLQRLAGLTKPNVQWWLLYLLTIGYLVVIGPVHYRWSKKVDYRLAIGGFLGTVAFFSLAFIVAGRRGAGEKQTSHSLVQARALGGDRWDVQSWVSAFAVDGDYYRIAHQGPSNYYAVPTSGETVNGRCIGGKDGHLDADIPLFSSRPFMHRGILSGPSSNVRIVKLDPRELELELPADLPEPSESYVFWRNQFLKLSRSGQRLQWKAENPSSTFTYGEFFHQERMSNFSYYAAQREDFDFSKLFVPLVATARGDVEQLQYAIKRRPNSADHLQLFLFAKGPSSFSPKAKDFDEGKVNALYIVDLFRPASDSSAGSSDETPPR